MRNTFPQIAVMGCAIPGISGRWLYEKEKMREQIFFLCSPPPQSRWASPSYSKRALSCLRVCFLLYPPTKRAARAGSRSYTFIYKRLSRFTHSHCCLRVSGEGGIFICSQGFFPRCDLQRQYVCRWNKESKNSIDLSDRDLAVWSAQSDCTAIQLMVAKCSLLLDGSISQLPMTSLNAWSFIPINKI